ncbi:MAG: cation-transporting P-type ATPase, partial [Alphaproteobacteria bacterium]|nr:cation-transporting P-type ATPase [Alphaproteobacteria bacterium]
MQATVDGRSYVLGNHRLIAERKQYSAALEQRLAEHENQGQTVTLLASDAGVLGLFAVADTIKSTSRDAVAELSSTTAQA